MENHVMPCDDRKLKRLLTASDHDVEVDPWMEHVDQCIECQSRLRELAADDQDWQKAVAVLASGNGNEPRFEREHAAQSNWNEAMVRQLLQPPSHPEMLGRLGRYEIERMIGSGGMGIVFKAFDTELNRVVAVKLLAPYLAARGSARKRFAREARAAAGVRDDHVVPIFNVESEKEPPFLVMQFVAGGSLQEKLDCDGPLDVPEVLRIGLQTAKGLAAAHAQGLIHRDVKPSNILLDEGVERALLTDFGLARAEDDACLTRSGFHPGTPHYMSPEQVRGESIDGRSDLFGLGCVLYSLCTGHSPFRADTSYAVMRRITDEEPRSIRETNPDVPDWLEAIVMKLLSKSRNDRFETAEQVAELLEGCLAHVQEPTTTLLPAPVVELVKSFGPHRKTSTSERLSGFRFPPIGKFVAAALAIPLLLAGILITLETRKGTITITSEVDDVPIVISKSGEVYDQLTIGRAGKSIRAYAGEYEITLSGEFDQLVIKDREIKLVRGKESVVEILATSEYHASVSKQGTKTGSRNPTGDMAQFLSQIQGNWRATRILDSGRSGPENLQVMLEFRARRYRMDVTGKESDAETGTITIVPDSLNSGFRKCDFVLTTGKKTPAIARLLSQDKLEICINEAGSDYPTAFESKPGSPNDLLLTFERIRVSGDSTDALPSPLEKVVINERAMYSAELEKHREVDAPRHPMTMQLSERLKQLDRLLKALKRFKYPRNGKNAITVWRQSTPRSGSFSTVHDDQAITLFDAIDSFEDRCAPMDKTAIAVFSEDGSRVEIVDYTTSGPFTPVYTLNRGQLVILLAPPEVNDAGMEGSPIVDNAQTKADVYMPLKVFEQPKDSTSGYWVGVVSEVLDGRDGRLVSISLKDVDSVKTGELLVVNRPQPEFDVVQYEQFATVEIKSVKDDNAVGLVVTSTRELVDNKYEFMRIQAGDRISRPRLDKKKSSDNTEVMTGKEPPVGRTDLKFQEVDRITSPDLESVCSVVFSPDGKQLYAAARDVCNLLVYQQKDSGSGPHTKLVQTIHSDENLEGALGLRVTPDGKYVVVTAFHSKTVCLYARDAETGKLTEKHVARDGVDGVIGLHWAFDCEVSPDSRFVYVTSSHTNRDASRLPEESEGNVTVFEIAGEKLRWVQTLTSSENTFDGAVHITTHPSGECLFVANYRSNAVVMLGRDRKTGEVTLSQAVFDSEELSLDGAYGARCSPDGKFLYASSGRFRGENGVTAFSLAQQDYFGGPSGPDILMKPIQTIRGDTIQGCSVELPDFAGGNRVLVSHDGKRVYVMGSLSGTLAAFDRYPKSGKLTEATITRVTSEGSGLGPASMCESSDGKYIYAAAQDHSSIIVLKRLLIRLQADNAFTDSVSKAESKLGFDSGNRVKLSPNDDNGETEYKPTPERILESLEKREKLEPKKIIGLYEKHPDGFTFKIETITDETQSDRKIGPGALHRCLYKCTVGFTEDIKASWPIPYSAKGKREEIVYIPVDHLHQAEDLGDSAGHDSTVGSRPQSRNAARISWPFRLRDEDGQPLAGATVSITGLRSDDNPGAHYGWPTDSLGAPPSAKTDSNGVVKLWYPKTVGKMPDPKRVSKATITITHPKFVGIVKDCDVAGAADERLKRGHALAITAIDANSKQPVERFGAYDYAFDTGAQWTLKNGELTTNSMPFRGTNVLLATLGDDKTRRFSSVISIDSHAIVKGRIEHVPMARGFRVQGKLDAKLPRPVVNGRVVAAVRFEESLDLKWYDYTDVNKDGTFTFESLPMGAELQLMAFADGWHCVSDGSRRGSVTGLTYKPQMPVLKATVMMQKSATIDVTVLDENERPVPQLKVYTWPSQSWFGNGSSRAGKGVRSGEWLDRSMRGDRAFVWDEWGSFSGVTNDQGVARLSNVLNTGVYTGIAIDSPDFYQPRMQSSGTYRSNFDLKPGQHNKVILQVRRYENEAHPRPTNSKARKKNKAGSGLAPNDTATKAKPQPATSADDKSLPESEPTAAQYRDDLKRLSAKLDQSKKSIEDVLQTIKRLETPRKDGKVPPGITSVEAQRHKLRELEESLAELQADKEFVERQLLSYLSVLEERCKVATKA